MMNWVGATMRLRPLQGGRHLRCGRRRPLGDGRAAGCNRLSVSHERLGDLAVAAGDLTAARAACDRLIVGLNSDASVKRLKGEGRPVQNERARAEVLAALEAVDLVAIFEEDTPLDLITQIKPSVLKKLRGQLPEGRPLTGVRIAADGKRVVVQDGSAAWNPESGQTLFAFAVDDLATAAAPHAKRAAEAARQEGGKLNADDWYLLGCDVEASSPADARDAYRRAVTATLSELTGEEGPA